MNSLAHFRYLALVLLAACGPSGGQSDATLTVTLLGAAYPVSQIVRPGDRGYFTVVFSDTTSHRYYASCSRAAFSGIEWETITPHVAVRVGVARGGVSDARTPESPPE
jgi:hypothetical protein